MPVKKARSKSNKRKTTTTRQKTIFESMKITPPKKKAGRPKGKKSSGTRTIHASQPLIKIVCDCKKT